MTEKNTPIGKPVLQITKEILVLVAENIPTHWRILGYLLHLDDSVIERIDVDHRYVTEKGLYILKEWQIKDGDEATLEKLMSVLDKLPRKDITAKIRKIMSKTIHKLLLAFLLLNFDV